MARPKKDPNDLRSKRESLYLTAAEQEALEDFAAAHGLDKAKVLVQALQAFLSGDTPTQQAIPAAPPPVAIPPQTGLIVVERIVDTAIGARKQRFGVVVHKCSSCGGEVAINDGWPADDIVCPYCGRRDTKRQYSAVIAKEVRP